MAPKVSLVMEQSAMVYFPGQSISGSVKVESTKKIKCKSLSISFVGFASIAWTVKKFNNLTNNAYQQRSRQHVFCAQEFYYEGQQLLWADPSQELPSGVSQFPFLFMLPLHSPASFVGKHGQVVHQMTVKLETKKAKDINVVQPYSVNAVVDLNLSPNFREPQLQQRTHSLCCWCCKNGPLSMVVRLNKSGYASGEPIVINAELNNKTKSTISGTKAKLIMEVTYKANGKFKCEERTLTKLSKGPIAKGAEDMWENEALLIPPLPPSPLPGCNIIDVCYKLQFLVSFKGASSDLKMTFPINLGTIPTVDSYPSAPQVPEPSAPPPYNPSEEASGGSHAWALFPGLEQYPQIPPPTYQQALALAGDDRGKVAPYDVLEQDSQASTSGAAGVGFTPYYVSYNGHTAPQPPTPAAPPLEKAPIS